MMAEKKLTNILKSAIDAMGKQKNRTILNHNNHKINISMHKYETKQIKEQDK